MAPGRKKTAVLAEPEVLDAQAEQRAEQAMVVMRQQAVADEAQTLAEVYRLGRLVGARQMNQWNMKMCAAADIHLLDEISKSKGYKHIQVKQADGSCAVAQNIDEFCRLVFNKSYRVVAESRQALNELGEECYELANSIGLPRAQMRLLLTLPEDERAAVEEAMRDGGKNEVVTLIQSLANKLDETRVQVEDLKADLQATQEVSSEKTVEIERLKEERVRIKKLPPDGVWAELVKETAEHVSEARDKLGTSVRSAFTALAQHGEAHGRQGGRHLMAGHIGELQKVLNELREDFGLRDVEGDGTPEWMNWSGDSADGRADPATR